MNPNGFLLAANACLVFAACAPELPQSDAESSDRIFHSDRISMITRGQGQDMIPIHGLPAHRDVWAGVAESLEDRYRLHLVQINGFGGFPPEANAEGAVSAPVAEEVARYIRESGLDQPAIVGHSMGGTIGMMLAARHPDFIGRLMVVDSTPFLGVAFGPPGTTPESAAPVADQIRKTILAQSSGSPEGMLEQMIAGMTRREEMRPALLQYSQDSHRPTVANAFHELIVTDLRPELAHITAPMTVLFVIPPNAPLPRDEFESAVHQEFHNVPHAKLVRVENSYHYIQFDQPSRFVAGVDVFMKN